jgi:hypothetical protein
MWQIFKVAVLQAQALPETYRATPRFNSQRTQRFQILPAL